MTIKKRLSVNATLLLVNSCTTLSTVMLIDVGFSFMIHKPFLRVLSVYKFWLLFIILILSTTALIAIMHNILRLSERMANVSELLHCCCVICFLDPWAICRRDITIFDRVNNATNLSSHKANSLTINPSYNPPLN